MSLPIPQIKQTLASVALLTAALGSAHCSSITSLTESVLTVAMTGTEVLPSGGASGNNDPSYESYTLKSVILTKSDGTTVVASTGSTTAFRVIDRPQIIATFNVTSDKGDTFNTIAVQFSPQVSGSGRYNSNLQFSMPEPTLTYSTPFTVVADQGERLDINVDWENTLYEVDSTKSDVLEAPGYDLVLSSD